MKIPVYYINAEDIISFNQMICEEGKNPHAVLNHDRIESSIHSALYPGSPPFAAGGIAGISASLCFYLIKGHAFQDGNKRTAVLSALTFMNENGWELLYPINESENKDALADLVEACASGKKSKEDMIAWFNLHKRLLD